MAPARPKLGTLGASDNGLVDGPALLSGLVWGGGGGLRHGTTRPTDARHCARGMRYAIASWIRGSAGICATWLIV